jgi:DNA-directed RNA polymerase specialized sigma24 family protein
MAATQGNVEAWNTLVERCHPAIVAILDRFELNPADCAQLYQSLWLRLVTHIGHIDRWEDVCPWLVATAEHECSRLVTR